MGQTNHEMMTSHTKTAVFYTRLQRRLHWIVIFLVILQYALQRPMKAVMAAADSAETLTLLQFLVSTLHTWGGVSIAAIMLWRWQLRRRIVPLAAGKLSPFRDKLVRIHHVCLYIALIMMALTGAMHYYLGWEMAATWHEWGKWLLLFLIGVHIAGALSHVTSDDAVFQRMMGRSSLR